MIQQIGLDSSKEQFSYDNEKHINIGLDSNQGLLPVDGASSILNEYEQYYREYDSSNKYRLIFSINPICSNVLFNNLTEIVYKEGSPECIFFNGKNTDISGISGLTTLSDYQKMTGRGLSIDRYDLIRDTAYSHKEIGPLVYHCGCDIFNNHTLRSKDFVIVNKLKKWGNGVEDVLKRDFNTLSDYMRNNDGDIIEDIKLNSTNSNTTFKKHLYTVNTIDNFVQAMDNNLIEENGWFGFKNPVSININNVSIDGGKTKFCVNKCMNNNKPGEFIDMYPDRSLYSIIPKYNKYRDRLEENWVYCLTYPYTSVDVETINTYEGLNSLKCTIVGITDIDLKQYNTIITFRTSVKHNLSISNRIKIAVYDKSSKTYNETTATIQIISIGMSGYDANHYFSVRVDDLIPILGKYADTDEVVKLSGNLLKDKLEFRFAKYVNGVRCKYYFRKFRKLPNFKHSGIFQDDSITDNDIVKVLKQKSKQFNSSLNKLAFAENIYSDKIGEIVFNEEVDVTGIKDNLGRDLSEIYLSIFKTNYGHNEWYKDGSYGSDKVEFSHCFGKITSGIDMSNSDKDYNIHTIHNIVGENRPSYIPSPGEALEDDITIDSDDYLGDLVELSLFNLNETVLEDIYHRFNTVQREFNTVQREIDDNYFATLYYDDIMYDDFDIDNSEGLNTFTVEKRIYNLTDKNNPNDQKPANMMAEGYYYKPHYRIQLKKFSEEVNVGTDQKIIYDPKKVERSGDTYVIITSKNYYLTINEKVVLYDKKTLEKYSGVIIAVNGPAFNIITLKTLDTQKDLSDLFIFKINPLKPSIAYSLDDGTGRYIWRNFSSITDLDMDDTLYNRPFTNGAHYIYDSIDLFLRRQDPDGIYKLRTGDGTMPISMMNLVIEGNYKDIDKFDYIEASDDVC